MNTDLHKRLEEAAGKMLNCNSCLSRIYGECKDKSKCSLYKNTLAGVKHGYKEAINVAKEWLIDHFSATVECNENGEPLAKSYIEGRKLAIEMVTRFETDMNKLLEERK